MTKLEFYTAVAAHTGMKKNDVKTVFEVAQEILFDTVKKDEEVKVFDGLTLFRAYKEPSMYRNPRTGEMFEASGKYIPKAKFGKIFKDSVQ